MKAALYCRISTDDKGQSPENQLGDLRSFCERCGYQVVAEYVDTCSGDIPLYDRPEGEKFWRDAYQRKFDAVVVWATDRLTREGFIPAMNYLSKLREYNIKYISYQEPELSQWGEFTELMLFIRSFMAKMERLRLSDRIKSGMRRARAEGRRIGRKPRVTGIKPEEILKLRKEGLSYRQISAKTGVPLTAVFKGIKSLNQTAL